MPARAVFAIPGDINTLTGGYGYDRRVLALLGECGARTDHQRLPDSYPFPDEEDVAETLSALSAAPADAVLLIDGLAYCALPAAAIPSIKQKIIALVHHPLGLEAGLTPAQSAALIAGERAALAHAARIIVTSVPTRDTLVADFGVAAARITIAEPGTDPAARAVGGGGVPLSILSVGSIVPRKAFSVLVEALSGLADKPWRLRIAGSADRSTATAAALRAQIAAAGLQERIVLIGELGPRELEGAYASADLFVLPSLYEGYGMVLAEALAHGLPIICTTGGAAGRTVPDGAGIKVPPGDAAALQGALARVLGDAPLRARLADGAWTAAQKLPRWRDTAAIVAEVILGVAGEKI